MANTIKSAFAIGLRLYHERLLLRPKPRNVIALEMTSARSRLEKISGPRILATFLMRVSTGAFLEISTPACLLGMHNIHEIFRYFRQVA